MNPMSMSGNDDSGGGDESFASLFEESQKKESLKEGDIVKGKIIAVGGENIIVDIGYKSEGTIPLHEFTDAEGKVTVAVGDVVDVFLESREDENGLVILSKEKADRHMVWDDIIPCTDSQHRPDGRG